MKTLFIVSTLLFSANTLAFDAGKFFQNQCATCHTVGGGDKIGPDLAGLSKRRKLDWIVKFVNYPDGMINGDEDEEGYEKPDPIAKKVYAAYKPQMMSEKEMTKDQVKAVLKWIDAQNKKPKGKILKVK